MLPLLEPLFGTGGSAALRDVALSFSGGYAMELESPGRFTFPVVAPGTPPRLFFDVGRGSVDFELAAFGNMDRVLLVDQGDTPDFLGGGVLEELGDGRLRLTIPLDFDLVLDRQRLRTLAPVTLDLALEGRIVAYSPVLPAPEPDVAFLVLTSLAVAAWLRRWTGGSR